MSRGKVPAAVVVWESLRHVTGRCVAVAAVVRFWQCLRPCASLLSLMMATVANCAV
jgi:hypothetical protein